MRKVCVLVHHRGIGCHELLEPHNEHVVIGGQRHPCIGVFHDASNLFILGIRKYTGGRALHVYRFHSVAFQQCLGGLGGDGDTLLMR